MDVKPNLKKPKIWKRVLSHLAWLLAWPLIMIVPSLVILLITAIIFYGIFRLGDVATGPQLRGYYFTFVIVVAVFCLVLTWLLGKINIYFLKAGRPTLLLYTIAGLVFGGLVVVNIPDANAGEDASTRQASVIAPTLLHDQQIIARMKEIGITDPVAFEKSSQQYVEAFTETDLIIPNQQGVFLSYVNPIDGRFSYGELKIKSGLSVDVERTVIAHEYLHFVWANTIEADSQYKEKMTSDLITLYGNDQPMQQRVRGYSDTQRLEPTELFAYYCTESSDAYLSAYLLGECNKYINRSALTLAR